MEEQIYIVVLIINYGALICCSLTASAISQPTIEDYMEISMEIMEKYDMVGKMEYGINMVPDRTLEEHRNSWKKSFL